MAVAARAYRVVFALVGWFAIGLQYWLTLQGDTGKSAAELTLNFFSYFTILMNVIVALALTGPALAPDSALGRWTATEGVRAAVAMYIAVVGVTYHFLLSHVWNPQGWLFVSNGLLHYVMPIAFALDWLMFPPKGGLRWIDAVKWLSVPLVYLVWTTLHGYASGWWPYWFMDLPALGLTKATFWFTAMLALFLIAGLIVVAINRTIGRRDRSRASA